MLVGFWLTDHEKEALAAAIALAMQSSMQAAYRWSAHLAGQAIEWFLPDTEKQRLQAIADDHAQGIADTYKTDLQNAVDRFLDAYETMLAEWCPARTSWKAPDVASSSCGVGGDDGTDLSIADALDGTTDLTDDDLASLWVGVVPEDAATEDICDKWAGQMVPFADAEEFPAHLRYPHRKTIIRT